MKKNHLKLMLHLGALLLCGSLPFQALAQNAAWEISLAKPKVEALTDVTETSFKATWSNVSRQQVEAGEKWNTVSFRLITTREFEASEDGVFAIANAKISPNPNGTTALGEGVQPQAFLDEALSQTGWIGSTASWTPSGIVIDGTKYGGLPPEMIGAMARITSPVLDLTGNDRKFTVKFKAKVVGDRAATMQVWGYGEEMTYNSGVPGTKQFSIPNDDKVHDYTFTFETGTWCSRVVIELYTETKVEFSDAIVVEQDLKKGDKGFRSTSYHAIDDFNAVTPDRNIDDLFGYDQYFVKYSMDFENLDPRCLDLDAADADGERVACRLLYSDVRPSYQDVKYNKSMYSDPAYFDNKPEEDDYIYLGYVGYETPNYEAALPSSPSWDGYHGGAIKATKDFLKNNIGDKVVGIRFATAACLQPNQENTGLASMYDPDVPFIFLAKKLRFNTDSEDSRGELIMSKTAERFEDGWNTVFFDEPYEITPESEFFAGLYAYDPAMKGGIVVASIEQKTENHDAIYLGTNWSSYTFAEAIFGSDFTTNQPLLIHLVIEPKNSSDQTRNKGVLQGITVPNIVSSEEPFTAIIDVANTGMKSISEITVTTDVDGEVSEKNIQVKPLIGPSTHALVEVTDIPFEKTSGEKTLKITLTKVNSIALETPSEVSTPIMVVKNDEVFQRTALVETFTSEQCVNCPEAEYDFSQLLINPDYVSFTEHVAVVSHHTFNAPDFMALTYSEGLAPFYGTVNKSGMISFASPSSPTMMIDRAEHPHLGEPKGANGVVYSHIRGNKPLFREALTYSVEKPAYVGATIHPYFDVATNTMKITMKGWVSPLLEVESPLHVTFMITQDEIKPRAQVGNMAQGFKHHNVLRVVDDAGFQGTELEVAEDGSFTLVKTIDIKSTDQTDPSQALPENTILLEGANDTLEKAMKRANVIALIHYYAPLPTLDDVEDADPRIRQNEVLNAVQRRVSFQAVDSAEDILGNEFSIIVENGSIRVNGGIVSFKVYDLSGVLCPSTNLISGSYIVSVLLTDGSQEIVKVIVP